MRTKLTGYGTKLAFIALALIASSASASANWPYYSSFSGWCGGNGYYSAYSRESIPYYALNPPVYYSYPVARTYGLYPFPYYADAEVATSRSVAVQPLLVTNRYVEQKLTAESNSFQRQPLRISNPFVEQTAVSNSVEKASWEDAKIAKPKVIYPIKLTSVK